MLLSPMSALKRITESSQTLRQVRKVPEAEMRCRLYFRSNTFLDFQLLLKQGERTKHEEHDLVRSAGLRTVTRSALVRLRRRRS
jgi:hypothetical protein